MIIDVIVISLDQSEYLVDNENNSLSVTITMNDVASQDVIVEVNVTDGSATGKHLITLYIFITLIRHVARGSRGSIIPLL